MEIKETILSVIKNLFPLEKYDLICLYSESIRWTQTLQIFWNNFHLRYVKILSLNNILSQTEHNTNSTG